MAKNTQTGSPPLVVNKTDWKKVGKGALIAVSGLALTLLVDVIPGIDFGKYQPYVAVVAAVLVNLIRLWVSNNQS